MRGLNEKIEEVEIEVKQAIQDAINGKNKRNIHQLKNIADELEHMKKEEYTNINYTRMIVDSWDFNDSLGVELLKLAESYKKWLRKK